MASRRGRGKPMGVGLFIAGALVVAAAAACSNSTSSSDDSEGGPLRCDYEVSSTDCDGNNYGPWEKDCNSIEHPKAGLTPSEWCASATEDDSECVSGCCVLYRYRNPKPSRGSCP